MGARTRWKVAVLPGDGIGPEVSAVAVRALEALGKTGGPSLELSWLDWPSAAYHREHGQIAPAGWLEELEGFDAILLGALGDPGPASDPERYRLTDAVGLAPLLEIRRGFDLWVCERPALLLEGAPRVLADPRAAELDMLVIRENSEGEYVGQGGRTARGSPAEVATQLGVFTRAGTERLLRHAFERARRRAAERERGERPDRRFETPGKGSSRAQVCLVTKRNALAHWGELYTEVFEEVAADFPEIATHHELVDAACMKFVLCPWAFDVVAASNLHGDILTDLAAVLSGGMGVAPSSNLNPTDRSRTPMFEPVHGSAPDIAGKGIAGPTAMLLCAGLMLEWMGEEDPKAAAAARRLRRIVERDLAEHGPRGRNTSAVGDAIVAHIEENRQ